MSRKKRVEAELSEYEMLREKNLKENKVMLAKLMADLEVFKPKAKAPPKKLTKRVSDPTDNLGRKNPSRAARRFSSIDYLPARVTRAASRRGSTASSICSSLSGSRESSPGKDEYDSLASPNLVVGGLSFFGRSKKRLDDFDEEQEDVHRKHRAHRDIRSVDDITDEDLDNIAASSTGKTYDTHYGTSCHQCRQKTIDQKTICRADQCYGVRGQFCGPCLKNRYGEDATEALKDAEWACPPCRGICNCSICRNNKGRRATGILIHLARERGFDDVNSYLQSLYDEKAQE